MTFEQPQTNDLLFEKSQALVPGGVHSPVRSFKGLPLSPRFIKEAYGAYLKDVEGKEYIDFCMSFGPLILGHRDPEVEAALTAGLQRGWSFGACEPYSLALAEFIIGKIPFIEQIRFVNSGTEAVMTALRLARAIAGKRKIIKFNGCYHGHVDSMLIKAGSGLAGEAESSSLGVSPEVASETLIVELGDLETLRATFADHPNDIAAIIVEPLPANNGLLLQSKEFLQALREICDQNGALLIFDEVISGFRAGFGGMAAKTGITPDIVTYGKIIGGGLPVGAIASSRANMEKLAPIGGVYQAGTLSANPLAMVGGLATLQKLTPATYQKINDRTRKICALFDQWFQTFNHGQFSDYKMVSEESLFWPVRGKCPHNIQEIPADLAAQFTPLFLELLNRGIYLSPNAYEVGFVSLAHDQKVIDDLEARLCK